MITFSLKRILSFLCAGAAVTTLVGCGGSGTEERGLAPDNIGSYVLQIDLSDPISGVSPGLLNVYGSGGSLQTGVNTGTMFTAQVTYVKTGKDTAVLSIGWFTPDPASNPTTSTWEVDCSITFTEQQQGTILGTITNWNYRYEYAGLVGNQSEGHGTSGIAKLVPR